MFKEIAVCEYPSLVIKLGDGTGVPEHYSNLIELYLTGIAEQLGGECLASLFAGNFPFERPSTTGDVVALLRRRCVRSTPDVHMVMIAAEAYYLRGLRYAIRCVETVIARRDAPNLCECSQDVIVVVGLHLGTTRDHFTSACRCTSQCICLHAAQPTSVPAS